MKKVKQILLDFIEITVIGSGVVLFIYIFVCQLLIVTGESMLPTFKDKEQIVAEKVSIKLNPIVRGEIIIFKHPQIPSRLLIKRVVGLPSELLTIKDGYIYINGKKMDEMYLKQGVVTHGERTIQESQEYRIPKNSYVLLGDNRENSTDSREWGAISKDGIVGRAFLVYYPFKNFRFIR